MSQNTCIHLINISHHLCMDIRFVYVSYLRHCHVRLELSSISTSYFLVSYLFFSIIFFQLKVNYNTKPFMLNWNIELVLLQSVCNFRTFTYFHPPQDLQAPQKSTGMNFSRKTLLNPSSLFQWSSQHSCRHLFRHTAAQFVNYLFQSIFKLIYYVKQSLWRCRLLTTSR